MRLHDRPAHKYSELEICSFEQQMQIILPSDYRKYLIETGAGALTPSKVMLLDEWGIPNDPSDFPNDFLAREFPHKERWNDLSLLNDSKGWESEYYHTRHAEGSMRIVNYGCEGYYILVVTGTERGNLWFDDRACNGTGISPLKGRLGLRLTFAEFLEISNEDGIAPEHQIATASRWWQFWK